MRSVIIGIFALVIGLVAGHSLAPEEAVFEEAVQEAALETMTEEQLPVAEDFVSLRPQIVTLPANGLSDAERAGLLLMREEEKLARDVYWTLYDAWGDSIFSNIAQSEETHTEAVRDLLVKYDIPDPVAADAVGVFTNEVMQKLYTELTAEGLRSYEAALTVGATVEDMDIKDLADLMAETDNEDIILVYENLQRGSRNHLRAFVSKLEQVGATYTPQYISEAEFTTIISSGPERGRRSNR